MASEGDINARRWRRMAFNTDKYETNLRASQELRSRCTRHIRIVKNRKRRKMRPMNMNTT